MRLSLVSRLAFTVLKSNFDWKLPHKVGKYRPLLTPVKSDVIQTRFIVFCKSWKMPFVRYFLQDPFRCKLFFGAIYLSIKEDSAFTCVIRACDSFTMGCICFSKALSSSLFLPLFRWPWENTDQWPIVCRLHQLNQTVLLLYKEQQPFWQQQKLPREIIKENLSNMK